MANLTHPYDAQPRELLDTMEGMGVFLEISPRAQKLIDDIAASGNFITAVCFESSPIVDFRLYKELSDFAQQEIKELLGGEIEGATLYPGHSLILKFKRQQTD